jgi:hypothetical protein
MGAGDGLGGNWELPAHRLLRAADRSAFLTGNRRCASGDSRPAERGAACVGAEPCSPQRKGLRGTVVPLSSTAAGRRTHYGRRKIDFLAQRAHVIAEDAAVGTRCVKLPIHRHPAIFFP